MLERAKFYAAQLRWSDRSVGLEFAPLTVDTGVDSRRAQRRTASGVAEGIGLLLQDDLERDGFGEGCGVVVIALPRPMTDEEIKASVARIEAIVRHDASLF